MWTTGSTGIDAGYAAIALDLEPVVRSQAGATVYAQWATLGPAAGEGTAGFTEGLEFSF